LWNKESSLEIKHYPWQNTINIKGFHWSEVIPVGDGMIIEGSSGTLGLSPVSGIIGISSSLGIVGAKIMRNTMITQNLGHKKKISPNLL